MRHQLKSSHREEYLPILAPYLSSTYQFDLKFLSPIRHSGKNHAHPDRSTVFVRSSEFEQNLAPAITFCGNDERTGGAAKTGEIDTRAFPVAHSDAEAAWSRFVLAGQYLPRSVPGRLGNKIAAFVFDKFLGQWLPCREVRRQVFGHYCELAGILSGIVTCIDIQFLETDRLQVRHAVLC